MTIKCKVSGIPEVKEAFRFGWFLFRILIVNNFILIREINRPFPSSLVPLFESKLKCEIILMKMTLICMKMKLHQNSSSYERFST